MDIVIPYNSLQYKNIDAGGRQVYLKNLIYMFGKINAIKNVNICGVPKEFRKKFLSDELNLRKISWHYSPPILMGYVSSRIYNRLLEFFISKQDNLIHFPFGLGLPNPTLINNKTIITVHDIYPEIIKSFYPPVKRSELKNIFAEIEKSNAHIIAVSGFIKSKLIEIYGLNPEKIHVVYSGCDPIYFKNHNKNYIEMVKQKYNLPERFIFFPAVKWPHKNHINAVDAVLSVRNFYPDIKLVLTGGWGTMNHLPQMKILGQKINNYNWIQDVGHVLSSEMPAFYKLASVMLFPSLSEGFGMPIIEAMASGCPVVCSDIEVFREIGSDAVIYVNPFDPEHITEGLIQVLNDRRLVTTLKSEGSSQSSRFSLDNIAKELSRVYLSL